MKYDLESGFLNLADAGHLAPGELYAARAQPPPFARTVALSPKGVVSANEWDVDEACRNLGVLLASVHVRQERPRLAPRPLLSCYLFLGSSGLVVNVDAFRIGVPAVVSVTVAGGLGS